MKRATFPALVLATLILASGCATGWRKQVNDTVPLYGHRNWICIVDSAYPAQSRNGIETIVVDTHQAEAVRFVLDAVAKQGHVRPEIFVDAELNKVAEADAPGIGAYRAELEKILAGAAVERKPHEQIIKELDEAGATFRVLILKTDMKLPYTSVFLRLNCGYWNAGSEQRLRDAIKADTK